MDNLPVSASERRQPIRLSTLSTLGVPIAWHEAVAIVRVVAERVIAQAPPVYVPRASDIVIDIDGDVVIDGGEAVELIPAQK